MCLHPLRFSSGSSQNFFPPSFCLKYLIRADPLKQEEHVLLIPGTNQLHVGNRNHQLVVISVSFPLQASLLVDSWCVNKAPQRGADMSRYLWLQWRHGRTCLPQLSLPALSVLAALRGSCQSPTDSWGRRRLLRAQTQTHKDGKTFIISSSECQFVRNEKSKSKKCLERATFCWKCVEQQLEKKLIVVTFMFKMFSTRSRLVMSHHSPNYWQFDKATKVEKWILSLTSWWKKLLFLFCL